MTKLRVQVWSDIACPWCYVGKRRLQAAIARMPSPEDVEVIWRSFELDPRAPRMQPPEPYDERLARKYRTSVDAANAMIARTTAAGATEGIEFRFDRVRRGNTFDAHRVLHLARGRGVQGAMKERLMRAYFAEGEAIGDRETLARLGADAGLDVDEVRGTLDGAAYADAVRADEEEAQRLGIHAVPFFAVSEEQGIAGAHPVEVLHRALMRALGEAVRAGPECGTR